VKNVSRRALLNIVGQGVLAGGALAVLGCSGDSKPKTPAPEAPAPAAPAKSAAAKADDGCSAELDAQSKQMRQTLQYVDKTPKEGQVCSDCAQWNDAAEGKVCGGCKLFTGPVHPDGYCLSYAPKS
jgi:hypothetical protein